VKGGEIVVLAGLVGAGRSELLQAVFGVDESWGGEVFIDGKKINIHGPLDAIRAGMALVPEDRKLNGLLVEMEIDNNIALPGFKDKLSNKGFVNWDKVDELAEKMVEKLDIRLYKVSQKAESLSGGNQQKVVLAKWLAMNPALLLLDEPTRGIDVGAKAEIYKLLEELASTGVAILVASSEMQEVLGIADRIVVMCEGRVTGELDPLKSGEEDIMKLATETEKWVK
jgi:ribose transport system ATP-binding protein